MISIELAGYKLGKLVGEMFLPLVRLGQMSEDKMIITARELMPTRNFNVALDFKAAGYRLGFLKVTGIDLDPVLSLPLDTPIFDGTYRVIRSAHGPRIYRIESRSRCQCHECGNLAVVEVWVRHSARYTLDRDENGQPEIENNVYRDVSFYCLHCGWSDADQLSGY